MKIFNGTSHEIALYSLSDVVSDEYGRKSYAKTGAKPLLVIPAGRDLNAAKGHSKLRAGLINSELPLKGAVTFLSHDPVPTDYDLVIVSNLYRSAVKELGGDTSRLATVDGVVYASEVGLRPCGCLALAVG